MRKSDVMKTIKQDTDKIHLQKCKISQKKERRHTASTKEDGDKTDSSLVAIKSKTKENVQRQKTYIKTSVSGYCGWVVAAAASSQI